MANDLPSSAPLHSSWRPVDLAFILDFIYYANIDRECGDEGSVVVIRALSQPRTRASSSWPNPDGEWFKASLRCIGVRDLTLIGFGPGPQQVMGFSIAYYSNRGWEGISAKVEDFEDNRLFFYCHRVIVESYEPLKCKPDV